MKIKDACKLFHEGTKVLSQMEANGLRIDEQYLNKAIEKIKRKIKKLESRLVKDSIFEKWKTEYKERTKLGSREQLAKIIFDILGYKCPEKTKTGRYKADETSFEKVKLSFVKDYFRLEKLKKAKSTYLDNLKREVINGYVHPYINLNTARSFRSSANNPNIQNQPIRNEELGKIIRKCYIPREDHNLVEIDYNALEVKIAACYHKDPAMLEYIRNPKKDMHMDMASQCYLLEPNQVSKQIRYCAKNMFVFPQFYGDYYIDCARHLWEAIGKMKLVDNNGKHLKDHLREKGIKKLGICDPKKRPVEGTFEYHIKQVEQSFWTVFSVYAQWKRDWWNKYLETGSFSTLTGFFVEGIYSRNEVINLPVQGSAFHCLLWSAIQIQKEIKKRKMKTKLLVEIHDSLLADVPIIEMNEYIALAKRIMTEEIKKAWSWIIVPLSIEVEVAKKSWYDKKQYIEENGKWMPKR